MRTGLVIASVMVVLVAAAAGVGFWMWNNTEAELAAAQAELAAAQARVAATEAELASSETELAAIEEVFPLRDFENYSELEVFVHGNIQPYTTTADKWYRAALKMQKLAMEQGYLVSAAISDMGGGNYVVFNMAVAGSILWWWDPEIGELHQYPITVYD